jgi:exodeoxyribonuclease-3
LSRRPYAEVIARDWCRLQDHRHVEVRLANGLWIDNYYVPAGGDVPNPASNPKFAHKLQFLRAVTTHYRALAISGAHRAVDVRLGDDVASHGLGLRLLVGDLSVAPLQTDVWLHQKLKNTITHTKIEIAGLNKLCRAFEGVDLMRRLVPPDTPLFTWWSYRSREGVQSNRGRRLDHAWATPALAPRCTAITVAQENRGWVRPSDHAPVIVDLNLL